jgi:DNA-binding NtrC family response regulator
VESNTKESAISLLIVEDDADFRDSSLRWMQRKGHRVAAAASGAEALALLDRQHFDVGVFDMNMPGMSGIELLQRVQQEQMDIEVIILTGQGTIESAVQAMKMGACDYLTKPCPLGDLEHHCQLAKERGRLRRENEQLKAIISRSTNKTVIIGESNDMQQVIKLIRRVAPTDKPVLISGESGTGKEIVAKAIHQASLLASKPFVTINCAALPEQLVESELFGHQKGSFTGATSEKPGLFEVADGGTLFIDELGEMPLALQPKLLRVLEDGSMRRIGSHRERKVNVRIIAATNRNLGEDVQAGKFREDLFYRVNVLPIQLPPLRERSGDIDLLISHFLQKPWVVDPDARRAMNAYAWPGNVRELINVIQRAMILADGDEITLDDLPRELTEGLCGSRDSTIDTTKPPAPPVQQTTQLGDRLDDIAKAHVLEVLRKHKGNKAQAARTLGIHRRKLYRLLERFAANEDQQSPADKSEGANESLADSRA